MASRAYLIHLVFGLLQRELQNLHLWLRYVFHELRHVGLDLEVVKNTLQRMVQMVLLLRQLVVLDQAKFALRQGAFLAAH